MEYDKPWEMWNVPTIPAEWSGADRLAPLIGGKILLLGGEYSPSRRLPGGKGDLKMDDINLPNRFEKNNEVVRERETGYLEYLGWRGSYTRCGKTAKA